MKFRPLPRRALLYIGAFLLLLIVFLFFGLAYKQLYQYSQKTDRTNRVFRGFQELSKEINRAAILTPDMLVGSNKANNLFFTDSARITNQLDSLKFIVRDSMNIALVAALDTQVRKEVLWLLHSSVPDSLIQKRAPEHVAAFYTIDSLINTGIGRTAYLVKTYNRLLNNALWAATIWLFISLLGSALLIIYIIQNLFRQTTQTEVKEEELKKSEALFQRLLDNMMEGVQIIDFNWRYLYVNDALCKYSRYTKEELLSKPIPELYPGVEHTDLYRVLKDCMENRKPHQLEDVFVFPDGSKDYFELSIQPVPEGIFILSVEITQRKLAEEELKARIKEVSDYRLALDESAIVAITDQRGIIKHANDNFCKISKYSREEIIGQDHRLINSGYHSKEFIKSIWTTIAHGKIWKGEIKNRAKDGTYYWVDTTIVPFLNDEGKPYQYMAIRADITERKKKEEEVEKANRLYSFISSINQSIVHIKEPQLLLDTACEIAVSIGKFKMAWIGRLDENNHLKIVSINGEDELVAETQKLSGIDYTNLIMRNTPAAQALITDEYVIHNDVQSDDALIGWREQFIKAGVKSSMALPLKKFGKTIGVFCFDSGMLNYFDKAEIELLIEAAGDISFGLEVMKKDQQRQESEQQLRLSEERLKKAQSIAHIGHWDLNFATGIAEWSEETLRIYGLDPNDTKQSFEVWQSFLHPDDREWVMNFVQEQYRTLRGNAFNHRIVRRDGTIHHIHTECKFEFDPTGKTIGMYGITQDVTEQRLAEEKLRYSTEKLNEAQAIAHVGSFEIDMANNTLTWSDEQFRILGFEPGEVEPSVDLLISMICSEDYKETTEKLSNAFQKFESASGNFRIVDNKGQSKHVFCEWRFEFDTNNKPQRMFGIIQDVTAAKLAEQEIKDLNENLESRITTRTAELHEANKDLEAFNYTVSHDLQSPLRTLSGFSKILLKAQGHVLDENSREMLGLIDNSAKRMSDLINELLQFARLGKTPLVKKPVNMHEVVEVVVNEVKLSTADFKGEIIVHQLNNACCDAGLIRQVWQNLIGNAVKYSSKREKPVIEIGMAELNSKPAYYVKDNGAGFDMAYADKLFGVFQRLHTTNEFEGTGVGLATVQKLIDKHGGQVWAESKMNEGAVFYFTLPESAES